MPMVKDEEAREALVSHAAENCCWGTKAAKELNFSNIDHSAAFHVSMMKYGSPYHSLWSETSPVKRKIRREIT